MKWLLKIFPVNSIIDFLCDLIIARLASKTKTKLDDKSIDKLLRPFLKELANKYTRDGSIKQALNNLALNSIDFVDSDIKEELLDKLKAV